MTWGGAPEDGFGGLAPEIEAVSFDLFGTLVTADRPPSPDEAVAAALRDRNVRVPPDWQAAYRTSHLDVEPLEELPLHEHVVAVLRSSGPGPDSIDEQTVRDAVTAAFDTPIHTRDGALAAVEGLAVQVPVGVLSNSSVEGLVERTVSRSDIPADAFAAVLPSVEIGWRKPHERAFERIAEELGVETSALLHVGDDPRADGAATRTGAKTVIVDDEGPLDLDARLVEAGWLR